MLHFKVKGIGKKYIILLSGFGCDHSIWNGLIPYLTSSYTFILIDNRGMGESDMPDEHISIDILVKDIIEVVDMLKIKSFSIMGHSLGGFVALFLLKKYPDRIDKIILCNSFMLLSSRTLAKARALVNILVNGDRTIDGIMSRENPFHLEKYLHAIEECPFWPPLIESNELYSTPILIINSCRDEFFVELPEHQVMKVFLDYKIYDVKSGHCSIVERPKEIASICFPFLNLSFH